MLSILLGVYSFMVFQPFVGHQKHALFSLDSNSSDRQVDVVDHAIFFSAPAVQMMHAVEVVQVWLSQPTVIFADFIKGFIQHTEVLFKNKFKQRSFAAHQRLIRWRKADLIFPFHYYW